MEYTTGSFDREANGKFGEVESLYIYFLIADFYQIDNKSDKTTY